MLPSRRFISLGVGVAAAVLGWLFGPATAHAYPLQGEVMVFPQPNGKDVQVVLSGDEFHLSARAPDGYALIKDPASGWICYAKPTADGDLVSSGIHYLGGKAPLPALAAAGILPHQGRSREKIGALAAATRRSLVGAPEHADSFDVAKAMLPAPKVGTATGLVVLVDFPDREGGISVSEVENAFNADTYGDARGSIRTWSETISYGQVSISHQVIGYMRAAYPTTHYKYGGEMDYSASTELYKEIYKYIDDTIDLAPFAVNGALQSLAVLYIGATISNGWASALWPHSGCGGRYTTSEKVTISSCYLSNLSTTTPIKLQTHRHELGHSFFKWPDTYDYDDDSKSAGGFAMETDIPCAPFRMWAGWIVPTVVNGIDQVYALPPNGDGFLRYNNPANTSEYFILEYVKKEGWNAKVPDEGLLIWHVDDKGDNSYQDMTATRHYRLSVEQADGLFQLEKNLASGGPGDCFKAGGKTTFDDTTTPNSKWWNGSTSGLQVCEVGQVAATMSVRVGCGTGSPSDGGLVRFDGGVAPDGAVVTSPDGSMADARDATRDTRDARGGSGGATGSGGAIGTGGAAATGTVATGGRTATGGTRMTGGATTTGGVTAAGGTSAQGGSAGSGGTAAGGAGGSGGSFPAGGAAGAGGVPAAGGSAATGGGSGTGGTSVPGVTQANSQSGCACAIGESPRNGWGALLSLVCLVSVAVFARIRRGRARRRR
jgi:M6 family metalloprotease-like protein